MLPGIIVLAVIMGKEDIQQLLVKYICSDVTADEKAAVKNWIALHPENELYFIELYQAWQSALVSGKSTINEDLAFKKFKKTTIDKEKAAPSRRYKVAALLLLPFLLATAIFIIATHHISGVVSVSAKSGALKKIILPDGTVIWLNAGSTINYDLNFCRTNRTVFLTGEALFDVGHKLNFFPFLVKTRDFTVRDVGTKFNLKAYPNDGFVQAAVLKGEVFIENNQPDINHNTNRIYVKPSQVLTMYYKKPLVVPVLKNTTATPATDKEEVRLLDVDSARMNVYDGWKNNLLIFDGARLDEISKILERKYNVHITIISPSLRAIKYTGNFNHVASVNAVLEIIKENTPLNYAVNGNQVTITNKN